ncbi:protein FAM114A2-like [Ptychodera flava]|uniref:protein FAM114A2-like n=1 Tax=Ptychodera flava TaxID=63121 RepID=UPI00396A31A0
MASSDEDGAFESADEGENEVQVKGKGKGNDAKEGDTKQKEITLHEKETEAENSETGKISEQTSEVKETTEKPKLGGGDNLDSEPSSIDTKLKTKITDTRQSDTLQKEDVLKDGKQSSERKTEVSLQEPVGNVITERAPPEKTPAEVEQEGKIHSALDKLASADDKGKDASSSSSSSSWGGWGSSWLSSATASVASMKQSVGQGLTSVIENVEASLGVPSPEELQEAVDINQEQTQEQEVPSKKEVKEKEKDASMDSGSDGGFFSAFGVSALTSVVEKTVSGGLDALEKIGKKTMDVLQEGDPGLRKKRSYFKDVTGGTKPNLSLLLREAKEEAAREAERQTQEEEFKKAHFGLLFDEYQGLAHLEALEMLSNQSEKKVQAVLGSLTGDNFESMKTELIEIKDAFQLDDMDESQELPSDEDFVNAITEHLFSLSIAATPDKLKKTQTKARTWLEECKKDQEAKDGEKAAKDPKDIHTVAIQTLAELTAKSIEQFHKASELMLLQQEKDKEKSPIERATSLSKLTTALGSEVSVLSTKFCECLNVAAESCENPSSVNPLITNVYLEASNSASYIQDAFQLVLPILQIVAIETRNAESKS